MKMFPRKPAKPEQLEYGGPKVDRPQWQRLSPKVKRQVTAILAQLIADFVAADRRASLRSFASTAPGLWVAYLSPLCHRSAKVVFATKLLQTPSGGKPLPVRCQVRWRLDPS